MSNSYYFAMVLIMIGVTAGLRFLPFALFRGNRETPAYIEYLGKVLPYAIVGMLVVYCFRNTPVMTAPHGIPELIALAVVVGLQVWRRNTLISILGGTVCYMVLVQMVFC